MTSCTVWFEHGELKLKFPFDRGIVEALKERFCKEWRWYDKEARIWSITAGQEKALKEFVFRHFDRVAVVNEGVPRITVYSAHVRELVAVLERCPESALRAVYKALAFALHPDRGGDGKLLSAFNAAWKRWKESR